MLCKHNTFCPSPSKLLGQKVAIVSINQNLIYGDVERTVAKFEDGRWLTTNEDAYEDDPPPAESSIITAVAKIDLWAC